MILNKQHSLIKALQQVPLLQLLALHTKGLGPVSLQGVQGAQWALAEASANRLAQSCPKLRAVIFTASNGEVKLMNIFRVEGLVVVVP